MVVELFELSPSMVVELFELSSSMVVKLLRYSSTMVDELFFDDEISCLNNSSMEIDELFEHSVFFDE
jgi:hypothetical protein